MSYSLFTRGTKDSCQTKVATRTYFNGAQVGGTYCWLTHSGYVRTQNFYVVEKSAQSQPRPQHRGKCKRKKLKQLVPTEGFRLIMTMASVNIQGYYDISSVVSPLLLLCKVCSVQCVCVLFFWFFFFFVSHLKTMIVPFICRSTWRHALHTLRKRFVTESQYVTFQLKFQLPGHQWSYLNVSNFSTEYLNSFLIITCFCPSVSKQT